jgi:hypothetical protein
MKKECAKLVINQNYVKMHGQQNIKYKLAVFVRTTANHKLNVWVICRNVERYETWTV